MPKLGSVAPSSGGGIIANSGSYTGNDTQNRPIPHGLGRKPSIVYLIDQTNVEVAMQQSGLSEIFSTSYACRHTVMDMNEINFYIGNSDEYFESMNSAGATIHWMAI